MERAPESSTLRVEGPEDENVVKYLLIRHGVDLKDATTQRAVRVLRADGIERLLGIIADDVKTASGRCAGFLLDADTSVEARWAQVRSELGKVGVETPEVLPPGGFFGDSKRFEARVGVWLMPDNQRAGAIEDFLVDLAPKENEVYRHAQTATDAAKALGAGFSNQHRFKAVLHAWLAWQLYPGLPYGFAIKNDYFTHKSPAAREFVAWFKRLYLESPPAPDAADADPTTP